jgi:hypothetical protein
MSEPKGVGIRLTRCERFTFKNVEFANFANPVVVADSKDFAFIDVKARWDISALRAHLGVPDTVSDGQLKEAARVARDEPKVDLAMRRIASIFGAANGSIELISKLMGLFRS